MTRFPCEDEYHHTEAQRRRLCRQRHADRTIIAKVRTFRKWEGLRHAGGRGAGAPPSVLSSWKSRTLPVQEPLPTINPMIRREYKMVAAAYVFMGMVRKGAKTVKRDDHIEIIVHYPETGEMQQELAKRVAIVHAQTVMEKLSTLSCPVEQKVQLIDAVIAKYKGCKR